MKFAAIETKHAVLSIRAQCEALGVSAQGYHQFAVGRHTPTAWQRADAELLPDLIAAHHIGRGNYGTPRLKVQLRTQGRGVSRRRIARLCKLLGLTVRCRRHFVRTTDSAHTRRIAPNLLNRAFVADAPNTVWVSDITYLWSADHWLYLCTIIDCFSGAIVGRQLARAIDATLVTQTLAMAIAARRPPAGCLFHSDRGSQYASDSFRDALATNGFVQSMSRRGNCWDNAVAESSFGRIKTELGDTFDSDYETMTAVYEYIDIFYNRIRIHSRHAMAPITFEQQQKIAA